MQASALLPDTISQCVYMHLSNRITVSFQRKQISQTSLSNRDKGFDY